MGRFFFLGGGGGGYSEFGGGGWGVEGRIRWSGPLGRTPRVGHSAIGDLVVAVVESRNQEVI